MATIIVIALAFAAVPAVFRLATELGKSTKVTENLRKLHLL